MDLRKLKTLIDLVADSGIAELEITEGLLLHDSAKTLEQLAALKALSDEGTVPVAKVAEAIAKYGINADKTNPLYA